MSKTVRGIRLMNIEVLKGLERNAIVLGAKTIDLGFSEEEVKYDMRDYLKQNGVRLFSLKDADKFYILATKLATKKVVMI